MKYRITYYCKTRRQVRTVSFTDRAQADDFARDVRYRGKPAQVEEVVL